MKDVMRKKRKLDDCGTVNLSANYSAVIHRRMLQKMQDLGSFTIPCAIGNHEFGRALCDSRVSINLTPFINGKKIKFRGVDSHLSNTPNGRHICCQTLGHYRRCVG